MNLIKKYNDWSLQPLRYSFNRTFVLVSVIYFLSTLFDFCFTYVTFRLDSDGFFMFEISFLIKRAFGGDLFFSCLLVVFVVCPLVIVYIFNVYYVRRYGWSINSIRVLLFTLYVISVLHVVGGLTNFFYLINI